jgi:hypothetical protein
MWRIERVLTVWTVALLLQALAHEKKSSGPRYWFWPKRQSKNLSASKLALRRELCFYRICSIFYLTTRNVAAFWMLFKLQSPARSVDLE